MTSRLSNSRGYRAARIAAVISLGIHGDAGAMGLRSFVALPVDKGGAVVRLVGDHAGDQGEGRLVLNLAYGLSGKQTILLGLPRRLSGDSHRTGDLSLLYRHTVLQHDQPGRTSRAAVLAGMVAPTRGGRDTRWQAGVVATWFRGRHEWDLDILWISGGQRDTVRHDISWQRRLAPRVRPSWGLEPEWWGVLEFNGRWVEGQDPVYQLTLGGQWIHPTWVLEGGIVRDLNSSGRNGWLAGARFHF